LVVILAVVLSLTVSVTAACAGDGAPEEPAAVPTLVDVLALIAQGVGAGFVLAFLAERFEWFQQLPARAKWWVIFGVSIAAPIAAQALLDFVPAHVWTQIEPYWQALALGFLSWAGSQAVHLGHKALVKAGRTFTVVGDN
jgi:hypothetical protein